MQFCRQQMEFLRNRLHRTRRHGNLCDKMRKLLGIFWGHLLEKQRSFSVLQNQESMKATYDAGWLSLTGRLMSLFRDKTPTQSGSPPQSPLPVCKCISNVASGDEAFVSCGLNKFIGF